MAMANGKYVYDYPRPAVTVDAVCFRRGSGRREVVLIRRRGEPYVGRWAVPGGFVEIDEDLPTAVRRELKEETGLVPGFLEQFYCFGDPGRDPRGRTISVAFIALVDDGQSVRAGDDASGVGWFAVGDLPALAFDHHRIIERAVATLQDWEKLGRVNW